MTERRFRRIDAMLRRRQPDLTILAEDVYKPHNLSAMLRSADAVGIGRVHAVTPTGGLPTFNATSASAEKWVALDVHADLDAALDRVRAMGMQVFAAHLSAEAVDYRDVDYVRPTCILFGNERAGVSAAAAAAADAHVIIPMLGMVPSLNVSVATAVILFEAQRQRRAAGCYDRVALSERERNDLAMRWLYPRLVRHYDARGWALPRLTEDGALPAGLALPSDDDATSQATLAAERKRDSDT
ncbi:MAG: tRNA (guanosine(18)-2'-O)-methyltransferase TrmH [Trueperaceae bacterium]|nr:MAG: tRNA (guanosine(18)-2'-O)-methyltransferase TrmH [Trueperaceae bacterium]